MWTQKEDLMFDENNLNETIRYCRTHNAILREDTDSEIEEKFWARVFEATAGGLKTSNLLSLEGKMEPIYNAWFIIDPAPRGYYPIEGDLSPGSHVINFFVRLGRKPALEAVR